MAEQLVSIPLFTNARVNGPSAVIASSSIDLRRDIIRAEALLFQCSSVVSTPDVGFFYAISPNGVDWGSFADVSALLTSTISLTNPQGWHAIPIPSLLTPFAKFACSGTGSNPTDTIVTAALLLRMN